MDRVVRRSGIWSAAAVLLGAGSAMAQQDVGAQKRTDQQNWNTASSIPGLYSDLVLAGKDKSGKDVVLFYKSGRLLDATHGGMDIPPDKVQVMGEQIRVLGPDDQQLIEFDVPPQAMVAGGMGADRMGPTRTSPDRMTGDRPTGDRAAANGQPRTYGTTETREFHSGGERPVVLGIIVDEGNSPRYEGTKSENVRVIKADRALADRYPRLEEGDLVMLVQSQPGSYTTTTNRTYGTTEPSTYDSSKNTRTQTTTKEPTRTTTRAATHQRDWPEMPNENFPGPFNHYRPTKSSVGDSREWN
jgi:hypothetical protein